MIIAFDEKYGLRYVEGEDAEQILNNMFMERYKAGWWDHEIESARVIKDSGDIHQIVEWMHDHRFCEYEGFWPVIVENANDIG